MKSSIKCAAYTVLVMIGVMLTGSAWSAHQAKASFTQARFERDRQSILAMAGAFKVTFDFRETVSFVADYQPIPAKVVDGHEVVKVIEDTGTKISLQHLLVVAGEEGMPVVVKHWRQTWVYEPTQVLVYVSAGRWSLKSTSSAERTGAWSQTVWQTDDSPRYGGVGRWVYDDGATRWSSDVTLRPLARRDAVRHPVYDHYLGTNRQVLTPTGWVHEQDNAKLGQRDGKTMTFVHEVVTNTYQHDTDFDVDAADQYWNKTKDYWLAVRGEWAATVQRQRGVTVTEEAENGSKTGPALMKLAKQISKDEIGVAEAIAAAQGEIANAAGISGI
jgi:hypothetical protein